MGTKMIEKSVEIIENEIQLLRLTLKNRKQYVQTLFFKQTKL